MDPMMMRAPKRTIRRRTVAYRAAAPVATEGLRGNVGLFTD
jgi:hypothetical protein